MEQISGDEMRRFAAEILGKPEIEITAKEALAAYSALRALHAGASKAQYVEVFRIAMLEIIE